MDFKKTETHHSMEALSQNIFRDQVSDAYHKLDQARTEGFDADLWRVLADAGLLGAIVGEDFGGSGLNFLEASTLLEAQGAVLAKLPLWQSIVAAQAIEKFGSMQNKQSLLPAFSAGDSHLTIAVAEAARNGLNSILCLNDDTVSGCVNNVAFAKDAAAILLPLKTERGHVLYLLDLNQDIVTVALQIASNNESHYQLTFHDMSIDPRRIIGPSSSLDMLEWVLQRSYVAIATLQLGVVEEAIKRTALYVSERHQFNKPLASFQAVSHRAANGYIDYSSLRACVWLAAYKISSGQDATTESRTAKWWACEAGHRIGHTAQHLHGGMGADIDYPIHRYFLWAKQLEYTLGGAQEQLAQLGKKLADDDGLGIAV